MIPYWSLSLIFHKDYGLLPNNAKVDNIVFTVIYIMSLIYCIFLIIKGEFGAYTIIYKLIQIGISIFTMAFPSLIIFLVIRGKQFGGNW